jgi:endonuclease/exonuclease/phosphatase family metal-dependent hydrolase
MKNLLKWFASIALLAGLYVCGVLIYGTVTDFNPPDFKALPAYGVPHGSIDSTITIVTWNIGYSGQGARADFFYDGGNQVRAPKDDVLHYRQGIAQFFADQREVDVFLIQEIDSVAHRSQRFDQVRYFADFLPGYRFSFAVNYDVKFVPMPLFNPMGKVVSGLATYSRLPADHFERHAFQSQFSWPTRIFFLDRCFMSHRTPLANGKDLVVINTHCSAYDTSGTMVADEIRRIVAFASNEYDKGNYVIIGGDWNQCPPNYHPINPEGGYNEHRLREDQLPQGWQWIADPNVPTNRKLNAPFSEASYTTVIDHFAISPNVEAISVQGIDQNFEWSDHQPVKITVKPR